MRLVHLLLMLIIVAVTSGEMHKAEGETLRHHYVMRCLQVIHPARESDVRRVRVTEDTRADPEGGYRNPPQAIDSRPNAPL